MAIAFDFNVQVNLLNNRLSGSHIMSLVLADQRGWLSPDGSAVFEVVQCGPFKPLRDAVNDKSADFFMWEHFTTKKFFDSGELRRLGEIYTPWSSWKIAARDATKDAVFRDSLNRMCKAIDKGIQHFRAHKGESIDYICSAMEYSREDAEEWMKGVKFPNHVAKVDDNTIRKVVSTLDKAGVLSSKETDVSDLVAR